jgi:hypothetical protein
MYMKIYAILLALLYAVSSVAGSDSSPKKFFEPDGFKQFHKTSEGAEYLADFDGMTTDGGHKIIWVRVVEPEPPSNKHRMEYATEYQYEITCSSGKIIMIRYAVYRSSGEELNSQIVNTESNIVPGTYLDTLVSIVCGKRR